MSVPGPLIGPCEPWVEGAGVAACCPGYDGTDAETLAALEVAALEASAVLYGISGRRFSGLCSSVARPSQSRCGCWGIPSSGIPAVWARGIPGFGYWRNECGDRTSCPPLQIVTLAPYPIREIVEVKIGGDVVDVGAYRLDRWRELVRTDGGRWPGCQDLSLDDAQPGTFSITYRHGAEIPALARAAAAEVACQILHACPGIAGAGGAECVLPDGVVQIARQGITVNRDQAVAWLSTTSRTDGRPNPAGLPMVDLFLHTYWPTSGRRGSAVLNVDRSFPRRTPLGAA